MQRSARQVNNSASFRRRASFAFQPMPTNPKNNGQMKAYIALMLNHLLAELEALVEMVSVDVPDPF
jgi:hypothetical protein